MRRSDGDITFQSLYHCCIHIHMNTYPDKAVETGKTAWTSRGQAPDTVVIKGSTRWTSRTGRPGQRTKGGHGVCNRGTRTAGPRTHRACRRHEKQVHDTRRTRERHRARQSGQRMAAAGEQLEDKRRGQEEEDKSRTRGGQDPYTEASRRVQGRGQPVWPAPFS